MTGRAMIFALAPSEAMALEGLVTTALQQALEELRKLAVSQHRAGRDVADEAAVRDFQASGLALLRSDLVRVYHHVLERVAADAAVPTGEGVPPLTFGQG